MRRQIIILSCVVALCACGTTQTVVEEVEVPVLYWEPMDNIKDAPDRHQLVSKELTEEQAMEAPRDAFRRLGVDIAKLIAENETLRHLYNELVKRATTKPEEAP
jgi:hypothetical protein